MSESMTFDEKSDAVMQSYQTISSSNQELKNSNLEYKNQNEYLKLQLGEAMKQKKKALASPTCSFRGDEDEEASNPLSSSGEGEPKKKARRERRQPANSNDFRIKIL